MAESTHPIPQSRTMGCITSALPVDRLVNVGDLERWLSLLGGGLLALYTVRRSLGSAVLLCGAGALLYRGLRGYCALYQTMGISTVGHNVQSESSRGVAAPDEPSRIVLAGS
jgi:uncharacterized membrane protein